jgi:alpha-mannosidase
MPDDESTASLRFRNSHHRRRLVQLVLSLIVMALSELNALAAYAAGATQTIFIVPHTHWEGAIFKTREEYLDIGLPNILKALYLLKKYPDYHFALDQMCYLRPFLERYPSEVAALREFLAQGRLQIVGGTDTMNDNNMPSGESTVRQYLYAKQFFRERLGYDVTTGWALDTFGHNGQMPQILKLAGMKSYWFMRGAATTDMPSEFVWQGIDGSRIPAFWLPLSYAALNQVPVSPIEFNNLLRTRFDSLAHFGHYPEKVILAGADVSEPEEALSSLAGQFNQAGMGFKAQIAVPADFERITAKRTDQPIIRGEFNPIGQGIYSNRIELKQSMREAERLLTTAEKLSVLASLLGAKTAPEKIEEAWEPVLFNAEHDPAAGAVVDKVYAEEIQDYGRARHLAEDSILRDFDSITDHIDTEGPGVPLMVFNGLGWPRTDVVQVDIPFSDPGVHAFSILDSQNNAVPIQFTSIIRNPDGGMRQARVAFIAHDIPALGYSIYRAVPNIQGSPEPPPPSDEFFASGLSNSAYQDGSIIDSGLYRVSFDLRTGAIAHLVLKDGNWDALRGPGNVVARETDGGDPWELHGQLSGGVIRTQKLALPPRAGYTQWSNDFSGFGAVTTGPVFSEYRTASRPFGNDRFGTSVRVYSGLTRVEVRTELANQEKFVRYRAVFPSTLSHGTLVQEIPFGAVERAQDQEFPAQNWVDYSDGKRGLALLNRGIPGNSVIGGTLTLSLLRSTNLAEYPIAGGNEPGVGSDSGLGVGTHYTLEYALIPHTGDWRSAKLWRAGMEFNNPLIAHTVSSHHAELPRTWGLLEISEDRVVLSALKSGNDGTTILRVYEAAGTPAPRVRLTFGRKIEQLHESNLIEDPGAELATDGGAFTFDLKPFEIKTFKFHVRGEATTNAERRH